MLTSDVSSFLYSGYMSPEYFLGGNLSEKIDVYSFGVIILEMVAGRKTRHSSNPESSKNPYEIVCIHLLL